MRFYCICLNCGALHVVVLLNHIISANTFRVHWASRPHTYLVEAWNIGTWNVCSYCYLGRMPVLISRCSKSSLVQLLLIWITWHLRSVLSNIHGFLWQQMLIFHTKSYVNHVIRTPNGVDWLPQLKKRAVHSFETSHHMLFFHCTVSSCLISGQPCHSSIACSHTILSSVEVPFGLGCTLKELLPPDDTVKVCSLCRYREVHAAMVL